MESQSFYEEVVLELSLTKDIEGGDMKWGHFMACTPKEGGNLSRC